MRPSLPLTLFLLATLAGGCQENKPVTLTLRPAAEVGPQVSAVPGPNGLSALEFIGGQTTSTWILLSDKAPGSVPADFVLRGKLQYTGGDNSHTHFDLYCHHVSHADGEAEKPASGSDDESDEPFSVDTVVNNPGSDGWHDFEIRFHSVPVDRPSEIQWLQLNLDLPPAAGVTVAGTIVIAPLVKADGRWQAKEPVGELELRSLEHMLPRVATVKDSNGMAAIEVDGDSMGGTYTLAIAEHPAISSSDYVLRGRVKYDSVSGDGYLELLSSFPGKGTFFSRSLADRGPLGELAGTSDWRDFELPFHAEPGMTPDRLTLNLFLPSRGQVTIAEPLVVEQSAATVGWWTPSQCILIGVGLAAFIGILSIMTGLLTWSGGSPPLTASLCGAGLAICTAALLVGLAALAAGQPAHVALPPLLLGGIGVCIFGIHLRQVARRFQVDELRRMAAADVV